MEVQDLRVRMYFEIPAFYSELNLANLQSKLKIFSDKMVFAPIIPQDFLFVEIKY